jgi:MFS transporter, DHA2 family, methylenomycin A resistance protein
MSPLLATTADAATMLTQSSHTTRSTYRNAYTGVTFQSIFRFYASSAFAALPAKNPNGAALATLHRSMAAARSRSSLHFGVSGSPGRQGQRLRAGRHRQRQTGPCKLTVSEMSREGAAAETATRSEPKLRSATSFTDWIPAVATGAAFFMIVLDTSIVNLALARIGTELNSSLATLQWLVDGYALVFASFLLGAGALGDRFGAKATFMCGLVVFTLASALCGMAPGIEALQISRIVQGIGAALLLPNSLAALNNAFADPLHRSKAISAWASAGALGVALGPVLGGVLVQVLGWRSIFIVNVPVGLAALWLAARHVPEGPRDSSRSLDVVGQVLAVGTLAIATYSLIGASHASSASSCWVSGVACVVLGIGFIAVEARQETPMLPLPLLRRRTLGPVALVGLLHNVSIYGLIFVLSLSFQRFRGLTPIGAGLLFLPLTVGLGIGTRVGAMVLRRCGPFYALIRGHFAACLGALILASFGYSLTPAALTLPLFVIGAGAGVTTPAMNWAVLDSVERTRGGLASGILNSARQTGGVIGVALLGALLGESTASAQVAEYVAAGILCLAGAVAFAAAKIPCSTMPATCTVASPESGRR